jgi:hypothetical protein
MSEIINNFQSRGEAEEITISSITKTMSDLLNTNVTFGEHKEYNPISEELSYYVVKLL